MTGVSLLVQIKYYTPPNAENNRPGKVGQQSAAAKYAAATAASDFSIEAEKPYAEVFFFL